MGAFYLEYDFILLTNVLILYGSNVQGAFDSFQHEHLPRTKYDATVDDTSNKPGEQAFEVRLFITLFPEIFTNTDMNLY